MKLSLPWRSLAPLRAPGCLGARATGPGDDDDDDDEAPIGDPPDDDEGDDWDDDDEEDEEPLQAAAYCAAACHGCGSTAQCGTSTGP